MNEIPRLRLSVSARNDVALVRRFLETGSEQAFRDLYRAHSSYIFCMAVRLLGGRREEAEEALQETWIRAAERLDVFQWRSSLRTWLGGITLNCCRELRRRQRPESELDEARPPASDHPPADTIDLERSIAALPHLQREVLVLFHMEGCSHEEIGERLDIPVGTSKSRLFEARRRLRQWLDTGSTDSASQIAGDPS
jgi:RNA polymerase sigma factor (sigma-70 family)